jgi:excisionase family DNA binding protein
MPRPITSRQLEVLRWIGDGCLPGRWADETHKASARALASRGLAQVGRPKSAGGAWSATLTEAGRYYLDHGRYPAPPPDPPAAADDVHASWQRAIRQAAPRVSSSSLPRQRRAMARRAAFLAPIVGDIPMRYTITISRVQTATRHVRAASEEEARKKIEDELSRPYGFLGAWQTVAQDLDLVAIESPLGDQPLPAHAALKDEGGFVLSIKATARFLGVPESAVRKLVHDGDMKHVRFGQRIYITRDQINDFLHANTNTGYVGRW